MNKSKPYTKITYNPDFEKFKTSGINDDMFKIMERRAYDMAANNWSPCKCLFQRN